jgi:hypothetical protein
MFTWTNEIHLTATPSNWQGLLNFSKAFYDRVMKDSKAIDSQGKHRAESLGGTFLVATLCCPCETGCVLFQCTIPRGKFRDNMIENGKTKAPEWWQATSVTKENGKAGRDGPDRLNIHAEDGAEYLLFSALHEKRITVKDGRRRLIAYGYMNCKTGQPVPGKQDLCYLPGAPKEPCCEVVAERLRIDYVRRGKTAEKQDNDDRLQAMQQKEKEQQPPPSSEYSDPGWTASQFKAATEQAQRPPSSKSGSSFSDPGWTKEDYEKAMEMAKKKPGSWSKAPAPPRQGDQAMDQLNQSMSGLKIGGGRSSPAVGQGGKSVVPPRPQGQPSRGPASQPAKNVGGRPSQAAAKDTQNKRPTNKPV